MPRRKGSRNTKKPCYIKKRYHIPIILIVIAFLFLLGINDDTINEADSARHAMDGIFLLDLIKDGGFFSPVEYIEQYFARYPALGIVFWPPLFPAVEALFYLIFGLNLISVKMALLLFYVILGIYCYKLFCETHGSPIAFVSSLFVVTNLYILKYSRVAMLEIPVMALMVVTIYYFYRWVKYKKDRDFYLTLIAFTLCLLTKDFALFLPAILLPYLLLTDWRLIKKVFTTGRLLSALVAFATIDIVWLLIKYTILNPQLVSVISTGTSIFSLENWLFYIKHLQQFLGIPILILFVLGIASYFIPKRHIRRILQEPKARNELIYILTGAAIYLLLSLIPWKNHRYLVIIIPFLIILSAVFTFRIKAKIKNVKITWIIISLVLIFQFVQASLFHLDYIRGHEKAAEFVYKNSKTKTVLFYGGENGRFVYNMRLLDKEKEFVVLRGSMVFSSFKSADGWVSGSRELVETPEDAIKLLNEYNVDYVIVEDINAFGFDSYHILLKSLKTQYFEPAKKVNLKTTFVGRANNLLVYENKHQDLSAKKDITIHFVQLNKNITIQR